MSDRDRSLNRHGAPDPSKWDEGQAVTGRKQADPEANTTLSDRAKARKESEDRLAGKQVAAEKVEDKAVTSAKTKAPAKKAAARKG